MLKPEFLRVFGLAPSGYSNPYLDLSNPSAEPIIIVSFYLNHVNWTGWYRPKDDKFYHKDFHDGDDYNIISSGHEAHIALTRLLEHFSDQLANGGVMFHLQRDAPDLDATA